ncbi:integrase family protein [Lentilitoribacter sp. Alg239-R112]|uniref:tyrosine-type recombinase/integrase n=1 Tax=Lentilitoribacter sp. Alg239-R112 TaxID=2305987 RepID=UPI0013A7099D|nr:integrase family protein [Lentilitoribacter sp. Alg239-R112]
MPNIRLTRKFIDSIEYPKSGQVIYRDTMLPGFGLRVGMKSKTYIVESQVNRKTKRVSVGRADLYPPETARRKALVILGDMAEGVNPNEEKRKKAAEKITVQNAFEKFFDTRAHLSKATVENYSRTGYIYLKAWAKKPMCEITKQMVLKRHQQMSRKNGKVTANDSFRHFRSVYNFIAATEDNFPPNPVLILSQARAWNKERRRQTIIEAKDLPSWWETVMEQQDYARDFLLIALFTGMRRGELQRLRWENIDLQERKLHLPTTKNGDPLMLPLSDYLFELLKDRKKKAKSSPWVFPGCGPKGHLAEPKKFLKRVAINSGVSFTLHDLRRTYITIAESLDIPHYALKRLLNHRTNSDVTGGYIVINVDRLRGPVELIANRILELKEPRGGLKE